MYKCKHFKIQELVSKQVYDKYKDFCWVFFEEGLLQDLDTIREYHGPITINDWSWGGTLQQCGFRSNMDPLVKGKKSLYCSAHTMAKGFDLHSNNIMKLYKDIEFLYNTGQLKAIRRIESSKSTKYQWCHVDTFRSDSKGLEVFIA